MISHQLQVFDAQVRAPRSRSRPSNAEVVANPVSLYIQHTRRQTELCKILKILQDNQVDADRAAVPVAPVADQTAHIVMGHDVRGSLGSQAAQTCRQVPDHPPPRQPVDGLELAKQYEAFKNGEPKFLEFLNKRVESERSGIKLLPL